MTTRTYILAANPVTWRNGDGSPRQMREVKERTGDGDSRVFAVVSDADCMDVLGAIRRAYQDGREDRSAEVVDPRNLREHLQREAKTQQDHGDDYGEMPTEAHCRQAHSHWGAAKALKGVIEYLDHELEVRQ